MSVPLLRGQMVRSHTRLFRHLNPRRQQSSSPSPSSFPSPSSTPLPNPADAVQRNAQAQASSQADTLSGPRLTQQGTDPGVKIDPVPNPNVVVAAALPPLSPFRQLLGPLKRAGQAYARAQRARPWATQVASALFIYLCADFGAQRMGPQGDGPREPGDSSEEKGRRHDWARTARSLVIGGTVAIPGYIWFKFLSCSFNYSSKILSIGVKVVVNQLTFTPLFNVYFFGAQALLSGDTLAAAWRRVRDTVPVSLANSWKLWPAVTAFSFAFVPFEYRNIFGGAIAVGWQTYLSYLNGRAERSEALRNAAHAAPGHAARPEAAAVVPAAPAEKTTAPATSMAATIGQA